MRVSRSVLERSSRREGVRRRVGMRLRRESGAVEAGGEERRARGTVTL
jgi:hypothetical protein